MFVKDSFRFGSALPQGLFAALALASAACSSSRADTGLSNAGAAGVLGNSGGASGAAAGGAAASGTGGSSLAAGGSGSPGGSGGSGGAPLGGAGGAPSINGLPALHVDGPHLKDPTGKKIVLRGVSLPDIGMLYATDMNASGISRRIDQILAAGLDVHFLRLPVYPRTCVNGAYPNYSPAPYPVGMAPPATATGMHLELTPDDYLAKILKPAVDYATQKGIYVIIDYHQIDDTSGQSATDATTFWTYMAAKFANQPNVLYEAFNEPIDNKTAWADFKPRAQIWVDTIRAAASDNLIIVGSMTYSQHPGDAADSPLTGTNLLYTAHVYPGNWKTGFQAQVTNAVSKVPVVFSEWGYDLNSKDQTLGTSDAAWGTSLQSVIDASGSSWTAWVADPSWGPRMFSDPNVTALTDFGALVKTWLAATASSDWVK